MVDQIPSGAVPVEDKKRPDACVDLRGGRVLHARNGRRMWCSAAQQTLAAGGPSRRRRRRQCGLLPGATHPVLVTHPAPPERLPPGRSGIPGSRNPGRYLLASYDTRHANFRPTELALLPDTLSTPSARYKEEQRGQSATAIITCILHISTLGESAKYEPFVRRWTLTMKKGAPSCVFFP